MLFIPFLNSHKKVAARAEKEGYGLILPFDDITKESLSVMIDKLIADPSFKEKASSASELFKSSPTPPLTEATFWIEHVIATNGAKHLRSRSVEMSCSQYWLFDIIIFFFIILLLSFLFWVFIIKLCITRWRSKENKAKFKYT